MRPTPPEQQADIRIKHARRFLKYALEGKVSRQEAIDYSRTLLDIAKSFLPGRS